MILKLKEALDPVRFTKFCITGAISFGVSFLVFNLSYITTGQLIFSVTLAYIASIINGFVWNRYWTFKDSRKHALWNQATRFAFFYSIGYGINLVVYAFILSILVKFQQSVHQHEHFYMIAFHILKGHAEQYSLLIVNVAGVFATGVMIIWNYLTSFFWSFRKT